MKIGQPPYDFKPITLTFETYEEAAAVMTLCGAVKLDGGRHQLATSEAYRLLQGCGVSSVPYKVTEHSLVFTAFQ